MRLTSVSTVLHHAPLSVLKTNLTKNDIPKVNKSIDTLVSDTQQAQEQTDNKIVEIGNSLSLNNYANQSVKGGAGALYSAFVIETVKNWNTESQIRDYFRVGVIVLVAALAISSYLVSLHKQKRNSKLQIETEKQQRIANEIRSANFLKTSARMVKRCAENNASERIAFIFPKFQKKMNSQSPGIVSDDLKNAWTEIGTLISQPNTSINQDQLNDYLTLMVLPTILDDAKEINFRLNLLGYKLSAKEQQDLEKLENFKITPPSEGESSQKNENAAKEKQEKANPASSTSEGKEEETNQDLEAIVVDPRERKSAS